MKQNWKKQVILGLVIGLPILSFSLGLGLGISNPFIPHFLIVDQQAHQNLTLNKGLVYYCDVYIMNVGRAGECEIEAMLIETNSDTIVDRAKKTVFLDRNQNSRERFILDCEMGKTYYAQIRLKTLFWLFK